METLQWLSRPQKGHAQVRDTAACGVMSVEVAVAVGTVAALEVASVSGWHDMYA